MKKREFIKSGLYAGGIGLLGHGSILSAVGSVAPSLASPGGELIPADYTTPSWTLYKRALAAGQGVEEALSLLQPKEQPFNIVSSVNGDPCTQMGVTWYTNAGEKGHYMEWVEGDSTVVGFANAGRIDAAETDVTDMNYNNRVNEELTDVFELHEKRSYVSHKVLLTGLHADTLYSYRVGKAGSFRTGSFRTAKSDGGDFDFIYIADTQAMKESYFDVSARTVSAAHSLVPGASFLLCSGDLIESNKGVYEGESTYYDDNSEWEWEQWFERMQSTWLQLPVVPVQGNHDTSPYSNLFHHFNTDRSFNATFGAGGKGTAMEGTVYSFVCGEALFMVINFEDYRKGEVYFQALESWMEEQVVNHPEVKWRIVTYHKTVFTGSSSHQDDSDGKTVRHRFAKVFERLGIDLALQGHDHIYEAIGVVTTHETEYSLVGNAVSERTWSEPVPRDSEKKYTPNMTGWSGGRFDVTRGMVYFLNNSAGLKKYTPRSREEMDNAINKHGITNYFDMFSRFGQTGLPTFSHVHVSLEAITLSTYTVDSEGQASLFDSIHIVRSGSKQGIEEVRNSGLKLHPAGHRLLRIETSEVVEDVRLYTFSGTRILSQRGNMLNLTGIPVGIYLITVRTGSQQYAERLVVKP
ncbi:MAG: fibronectin type III domain-containing protein [Tannerellaceae bacterium]|jgi:3',5'-cyclic AMP phosphodiesterase CpdA|nr:fibronectin type III domain-containing protein [Tannerellaceae bacterium]